MRPLALTALLLAGCNAGGLRYHSTRNAPGNIEIDQPLPRERGEPGAYVEPTDPGEHQLGVAPGAWIHFGTGRVPPEGFQDDVSVELGVQVQLAFGERDRTGNKGAIGFPLDSWGATFGWAFVQTNGDLPATIGPVFVEATRTYYLVQASAGVAIYPTPGEVVGGRADGVDVGGQLTLSAAVFSVRLRYVQDSGFEAYAGYQFVLPSSITWSR